MSSRAKAALVASFAISGAIIWGVHYQQHKEREDMFQGVLRDDERRREKMRRRQEDFQESQRKREVYESTQTVVSGKGSSHP
ncbi:hypothetical protein BDN67DRAFT_920428 [Paxillus ammoniavirescens]|nr:hypothetical protein BDN67DRAFT_920428 [Paxillus ammoniavirescens]